MQSISTYYILKAVDDDARNTHEIAKLHVKELLH